MGPEQQRASDMEQRLAIVAANRDRKQPQWRKDERVPATTPVG